MTAQAVLECVRQRVMRHGRLTAAYQVLNPGFRYWLDDAADAAAGYVRRGDWWAVGGGPICAAGVEATAVERLESAAAAERCKVVYVAADAALRETTDRLGGHGVATLGAEPVWDPRQWWQRPAGSASLRQQLRRARNKDVTVERWGADRLANEADDLKPVVAAWVMTRPLPAMAFLNDPRTLDGVLTDRVAWVARRQGRIVAFLLASPVVARGGYLIEQLARRPDAPNGTAEVLIDCAMRDFALWDCRYATLGLVVLSQKVADWMDRNPPWARMLFAMARLHGRRFYNYDGLARFREKLRPDAWEPVHLIANVQPFPFAALYAAGAAFCGRFSPAGVVSRGIGKAIVTETGWLRDRLTRPAPATRS